MKLANGVLNISRITTHKLLQLINVSKKLVNAQQMIYALIVGVIPSKYILLRMTPQVHHNVSSEFVDAANKLAYLNVWIAPLIMYLILKKNASRKQKTVRYLRNPIHAQSVIEDSH